MTAVLRLHAEQRHAEELEELARVDTHSRPPQWRLSPWAVATFILGGTLENGFIVEPKYIGQRRLVEIAIATLTTDRALLLLGVPGTAKTWLAEHLAAAISGDSTLLVQGTAGTSEDLLRYGWNYARLLTEGPSYAALVASPIMHAMQAGKLARVEELTRIPADVQDTLITILSEKTLPIPELSGEVQAVEGFNVAAFYPFAVFSPEWQALRYAVAHDVPARFIDLAPSQYFALPGEAMRPPESKERLRGDPIAAVARIAGYADPERWWEHMVEQRRDGPATFAAITDLMAELRQMAAADPDEALREASMRQHSCDR